MKTRALVALLAIVTLRNATRRSCRHCSGIERGPNQKVINSATSPRATTPAGWVSEPYVRHHVAVTRGRIRVIFLSSDFPRIMIRGKWSSKIRRRFASNIEGNLLSRSTAIFHIMLYSFARLVKWKEFCSISEVKSHFEICGDHFQEDCFLNRKRNALRWDAVPTISTRVQRGRFCWFSFSCDYCSVRNDCCKGKSLIT